MPPLKTEVCTPCSKGAPKATAEECQQYLSELPDWQIQTIEGTDRLVRSYRFRNFVQALEFTNKIGALAEEHGHHPALLTEWGQVTLSWWTHKIGGLHKTDFIMAAKSDQLFSP